MADTITEFFNSNSLTYNDVVTGVQLISNGPKEMSVVRDVTVANTSTCALSLNVGPMAVTTLNGSCNLSGTELIGANSSLVLKASSKAVVNEVFCASRDSVQRIHLPTLFSPESMRSGMAASSSNILGTSLAISPIFTCFDATGNFYYCSSSLLYKRAGGVNGVETTYPFGGVAICYDGSRYIYSFWSDKVFTFDTQSSLVSSVSTVSVDNNTACASALDGRIFLKPSFGSNGNYIVNPGTGAYISLPGYSSASGQQYFSGLGKDNAGDYIAWQSDYTSPDFYWWNLGKNIYSPIVVQSGKAYLGLIAQNGAGKCVRQVGSSTLFYVASNSSLQIIDIATKSAYTAQNLTNALGSPLYVPPANISLANTDLGTIGCRVTGIKVIGG